MSRMLVVLEGTTEANGAPLVTHNERLADPLNPFSLAIGQFSRKRRKTEADHLEIARIEHAGALYHDGSEEWLLNHVDDDDLIVEGFMSDPNLEPDLGPYIPTWNILRCIQEAGKRHKLGQDVLRGVSPVKAKAPIQYDGPRDIEGLWFDGRFVLRKSVGVQRARTMRTRPIFTDWRLEAEFELDLTIMDTNRLHQLVYEAGKFVGLCEMRPIYGRFAGSAQPVGVEDAPPKTRKRKSTEVAA